MTHPETTFTLHCPLGANPVPLIELAMQVRFKDIPSYEFSWASRNNVAVTIQEEWPKQQSSLISPVRGIKIILILVLLVILFFCQQRWQRQNVERVKERNHINNDKYHIANRLSTLKMTKSLSVALSRSIYIRLIEINKKGWHIDAVGTESEVRKLESSWKTKIPIIKTQDDLITITGDGTW